MPSWFNEGLASLYEQCAISRDNRSITGLANWRLPALKQAIRRETLRPLRELIEDEHFYADDRVGMNYAQARYLLMYLQEKKLLTDYYAHFRVTPDLIELRNLLEVADLIVRSALSRQESRGLHYTLDFPETLPEPRDTVLVP